MDYLRVVVFAVLIDVLGLSFTWYAAPYCAIIVTLGTLIIEGKSVLENFQKKKSSAAQVVDIIQAIVDATDNDTAEKIIKAIKSDGKLRKEENGNTKGNGRRRLLTEQYTKRGIGNLFPWMTFSISTQGTMMR